MEPIFDTLTITAIISATCVTLLVLVLADCCKMKKLIQQFFGDE